MKRRVSWVLLCEDEQQYAFAHRFLKALLGTRSRGIRKVLGPGAAGVRARFATEVQLVRSRGDTAGLVAFIDADSFTVQDRKQFVADACGKKALTTSDPVAILVPRRNIETWIAYLGGTDVDETVLYPKLDRERDCAPAVDALKRMCDQQQLRPPAPLSLEDACGEFQRLRTKLLRP